MINAANNLSARFVLTQYPAGLDHNRTPTSDREFSSCLLWYPYLVTCDFLSPLKKNVQRQKNIGYEKKLIFAVKYVHTANFIFIC